MDGTTPSSSNSEASNIAKDLSKLTTEDITRSTLTDSVSMTDLGASASTGTVIHIPDNAGTTLFNQQLVQQFLDIMKGQHNDSPKRKRDEELSSNNGGSKKTKPNIPDRYQSRYKEARNIRSKQEKYGMNDSTLRRYTTFDDHLVPKPSEVTISLYY